jgi:hypothetical protein
MSKLTEFVPCPPPESINTGVSPCPTNMLVKRRGMPRAKLTDQCLSVTSIWWGHRMVTKNVGPFKVTGFDLAVELLTSSLATVKAKNPELYAALGSAGMLCCRHVRGVPGLLSNHALGMAIDFTIEGVLDTRGDGKVQRGLLDLYGVMKGFGWFWGAEFRIEDGMHFEVGGEVIRQWINQGRL